MVKTLQDYCLACIAKNISTYNRLGNFLSRRHKESLIERMCWHQLFTPGNAPSISYHLFSSTLQRVNLSYSTQVDDKALEVLARSGCLPTSITIHDCPKVTDAGITSLAKIVTKTEELNLQRLKKLTSEGLKSISSTALTSISLRESDGLTDPGVIAMLRKCPNVEKLALCELHKLTDTSVVNAAEVFGPKLVELDVSDLNLITCISTLALARHCKNLSVASFESCVRLDGTGLVEMAERCNLCSLCLSFCYKVSKYNLDVIISLLRAKGNLHTFEALGVGVSPTALELLASTSCLAYLSLCGVPGVTDESVELITRVAGQNLIELDVSNCLTLTDQSCTSIVRHCKCIESLGLRNLREIRTAELSRLFLDSRANSFRSITLSGSRNLPAEVVETIVTHCPNLEVITLAGLKDITDDVALGIANHCTSIQSMSFRNCELTDTGVCEIAVHCSKLQMIALAGIHGLTDKCIIALAENCAYIEELYISGCAKITKQAVTYLKDCAVNRVFVNHSTPNAPFGLLMAKDLDTGEYTRVDDIELPPVNLKKL